MGPESSQISALSHSFVILTPLPSKQPPSENGSLKCGASAVAKNKETPRAWSPQSSWTRAAQHYARDSTHTIRDLDLELIEDLLNGFHVGLQVPGFRRDRGQSPGQNRVQVEPEDPVHKVAGEGRLERSQSAHVSVGLLSLCARFLSIV